MSNSNKPAHSIAKRAIIGIVAAVMLCVAFFGGYSLSLYSYGPLWQTDIELEAGEAETAQDEDDEAAVENEDGSVAINTNDAAVTASCDPVTYGADPAGVKDSSAAIAACIEANKGGRVTFSVGTYLISEPIRTPHLAMDRVSIDFNGATVIPSESMDCVLDIGGLGSEMTSEAGVIRTYYKNAILMNQDGLSIAGIKVAPLYKDASFDCCNVIGFKHGAEISALGTEKPSDSQFTNCFLCYSDVSDEDSYGVGYFGSDNKMADCRIYGFHYSIYLRGGGFFARNVHNLPKGLTNNYVEELQGSAFMFANASFTLSECYCDTYETFIDVRNNVQGTLVGCRMYSFKDPMRMQLIKFSNEGNFTGQIILDNVVSTPRAHPVEGERNTSVVFSPEDDKIQLFRSGLVVDNCTLTGTFSTLNANLHGLDVLTTPSNKTLLPSYHRGETVPEGTWVPLCGFLLTPTKVSTLSFNLSDYSGQISNLNLQMAIAKSGNGELTVSSSSDGPGFPLTLGYSYAFDESQGLYKYVIWCQSDSGPYVTLSTINDIRCDNAFPVDVWNTARSHYHGYSARLLDSEFVPTDPVVPFYQRVE